MRTICNGDNPSCSHGVPRESWFELLGLASFDGVSNMLAERTGGVALPVRVEVRINMPNEAGADMTTRLIEMKYFDGEETQASGRRLAQ